ncbi:hypothetical protein [Acidiluteibacter ferrifornacis]|uniref:Transmembrane protein n=1 Tax=Acidiluteibacter ferrifornacis TaxID=2692424 RepID=A0A6N9NM04_9FLAO|nr:hypothetical protein [Acidiluteibacter ferrifornacis]NBG65595.1 hypothetical protein [Acidiluteibacter ferrifornacis]
MINYKTAKQFLLLGKLKILLLLSSQQILHGRCKEFRSLNINENNKVVDQHYKKMKITYKIFAFLTLIQSGIHIILILRLYPFNTANGIIYWKFKEQELLLLILTLIPALIFSIWTLLKKSTLEIDENSQLEKENTILEKKIKKKELEQKLQALGKADEK